MRENETHLSDIKSSQNVVKKIKELVMGVHVFEGIQL